MMPGLVRVETIEPGVACVTLDRADRRNALCIDLLEQLCTAIQNLANDTAIRVVILRGAGPVFSAGLDLREAADNALIEQSATAVSRTLELLRSCPLIVVAAVLGGAYAGGAGVMAACDIVIAADDALIGFPEARRGLLPAIICDVLIRKVREGDLAELFLTGEPVSATRARELGLVQRVVPAERLQDEALSVARAIIAGGPDTIRQTKSLLNVLFHSTVEHRNDDFVKQHLAARYSKEAREGLAAFAEKRKPNW
ncbi:MAG TPA: enoyl-CoA hydratase-related protein [Lacipirellulaceae bacterium]|nr:enoyl-CoA hydratase-related protein [Lacipirellulaceae bacterium]